MRFIPAPAGNTARLDKKIGRFGVHPRACGEHLSVALYFGNSHGSSPRLRGTRPPVVIADCVHRFIPAPAGNTSEWRGCPPGLPVHPRACGEHYDPYTNSWNWGGSSPRLRGTPRADRKGAGISRFIPAPAGNTTTPKRNISNKAVHPRACGEHVNRDLATIKRLGSSPRLRGTHVPAPGPQTLARFIPAPAGNTPPDR